MFLLHCGKESEEFKIKKDPVKTVYDKAPKEKEALPEITEIKFTSRRDTEHDLVVSVILSKQDQDLDFSFRWIVNKTEIEGEKTNRLSRDFFKSDDWVYCWVKMVKAGKSFREHKSKLVKIKGSIPIIELAKIGNFEIPGEFRYRINARLPKDKDYEEEGTDEQSEPSVTPPEEEPEEENDEEPELKLKFELISPLDKGINLDTLTGEISWMITLELAEELGEKTEIKFKVINPSGRSVKSSIILTLKKTEKKENEGVDIKTGNEVDF